MIVVGELILDPTQVKVYELPDTVVSMTPQGSPEGTLVAIYEVREAPVPVIVPAYVPVPVPVMVPVLVPVVEPLIPVPIFVAVFRPGKEVVVPSTWICPLVALAGIAMVWPEEVRLGPPGINVMVPAIRLVRLPVKTIPSIVYVDEVAGAFVVIGVGKLVELPST